MIRGFHFFAYRNDEGEVFNRRCNRVFENLRVMDQNSLMVEEGRELRLPIRGCASGITAYLSLIDPIYL